MSEVEKRLSNSIVIPKKVVGVRGTRMQPAILMSGLIRC